MTVPLETLYARIDALTAALDAICKTCSASYLARHMKADEFEEVLRCALALKETLIDIDKEAKDGL